MYDYRRPTYEADPMLAEPRALTQMLPDPQETYGNAAVAEWTASEHKTDYGAGGTSTNSHTGAFDLDKFELAYARNQHVTEVLDEGPDGAQSTLDDGKKDQVTVKGNGLGWTHTDSQSLEAADGTATANERNYGGAVSYGEGGLSGTGSYGSSVTDTDAFGNKTETGTSGSVTIGSDGGQGTVSTGTKVTDADGTVHDRTRSGTLILEEDQVGGGYGQNGWSGQATYNPEENSVAAGGSVTTGGGTKVGLGVDLRHDTENGTKTTSFNENAVLDAVLGTGSEYGYATEINSWGVNASAGAGGVEVSGGMKSGSSITAFERLPAGWDQRSEADKKAWLAAQEERAAKYDGIADVDLTTMTAGQGFEFRSYNGWHAQAGVSYGMLSAEGGGGTADAQDLGLSFDGDRYHVALRTEHDVDSNLGVGALGHNLEVGSHGGENEQFAFTVNADDPVAMEALDAFMETGLLPGADKIQTQEATAAAATFHGARADVDRLTGEIDALQAAIGNALVPDPALEQQLLTLTSQQFEAQAALADSRSTLNTMWGDSYSPSHQPPISGVTVTQAVEEQEEGSSLAVGGTQVSELQQVVGHEEELVAGGGVVDRYYMNQSATLFGEEMSTYGINAYAGETSLAVTASARSDLSVADNFAAVQNIDDNSIPDWVLAEGANNDNHHFSQMLDGDDEAWEGLRGETRLNLTTDTLDAYSGVANDPNSAYSQDLWSGFSERAGAFWSEDSQWWSPELQAQLEGSGASDHWDSARDQMINSTYDLSQSAQERGYTEDLWTVMPDPNLPRAEVARMMSSVTSPEDFQNLPPAWQQVYIDTIVATSIETSPYDAMAAIALIPDEKVRAQETRELLLKMDTDGQVIGSGMSEAYSFYNDAMLDFADWTQQFAGTDPALYASLQGSLSYRVTNERIGELEGKDPTALGASLKEGAQRIDTDLFGSESDPDEELMFDTLMAGYNQSGNAGVDAVVAGSGLSPAQVLEAMAGDPRRQAWVAQMLVDAGEGPALQANAASLLGTATSIEQYERLAAVLEGAGATHVQSAGAAPTVDAPLLASMAGQDPAALGATMRAEEQIHSGLFGEWDPNTGYMATALTSVHGDPAKSAALIQGYLEAAAADSHGGDEVTNLLKALERQGTVTQVGLALDVLRDAGYGDEVAAWTADRR